MLAAGGTPLPSGEEVRQALEHVFARPEFRPEAPGVWDRIMQSIRDALEAMFHAIHGLFGDTLTSTWAEVLALIVLLVILGAILGHLAWSVLQLRVAPEKELAAPDEPEGPAADGGRRRPGLTEAARLAAAGAFAEAMHALYHGAVIWLDQHGHVRFERFKTGAEYTSDLGAPLRPRFRLLLAAYYPVAFGGRRAGEAEWLAMRRAASDLGVPA